MCCSVLKTSLQAVFMKMPVRSLLQRDQAEKGEPGTDKGSKESGLTEAKGL